MGLPYTRFFWSDWNADTAHLDLMHLGAYMKLISYMYQHARPLPGDQQQIFRICHAPTPTEQNAIKAVLAEFFIEHEDLEHGQQYRHHRVEREIEWSSETSRARSAAAKRANKARWGSQTDHKRIPNGLRTDSGRNPNQNQNQILPTDVGNKGGRRFTPPSLSQLTAYCQQRGNSVDPEAFLDHYTANGWMRGKTKIKDWKACVRTWEKNREESKRPGEPSFLDTCKDFAAGKLG